MNDGHKPWLQRITPDPVVQTTYRDSRPVTRTELEILVDALRCVFAGNGRSHEYAELRKALGMEDK